MTRSTMIAAAIAASLVTGRADAQLGLLFGKSLGMPAMGEAGGAYRSNNELRTYVTDRPYGDPAELYRKVVLKAAEMTRDKGFPAFGVTKYSCTTSLRNNRPIADSCVVIATMLQEGEQAKPRGKRPVLNYAVGEVLAGTIALPPPEAD